MSEGQRLQLATAHNLATRIRDSFAGVCEKIEIVGSIRRRKATVGDIEFVYIPRFQSAGQISFLDVDTTESLFDKAIIAEISRRPSFHKGARFGPRFKQCLVDLPDVGDQVKVEFYLAEPGNWGFIKALRTGSSAFNKAWAVQKANRGWLPDDFRFVGGWLIRAGERIETPTERGLFEVIGLPWIEPPKRTRATLSQYQHLYGPLPTGYSIEEPQPA